MYLKARTEAYFNDVKSVLNRIYQRVISAHEKDKQVFLIGDGGRAANASHAACDLGKGIVCPGHRRFREVSFADNAPVSTA